MATTSIWSVKGWLGKVVIYVENPEKTEAPRCKKLNSITDQAAQGLADVIAYAVQERKTAVVEGENSGKHDDALLLQQYVSGVNCAAVTARTEMLAVKKRFGKENGVVAYHGYQSFAPGECTPGQAHEIGVKLATQLWGDRYQVLVATHLDKEHHLHNHFVINTVSFVDGKRYHRTKQDYRDMQRISDQLCREYGLSVIDDPKSGRAQHYGEWRAEQEDRPTWRGLIRSDVEACIKLARTESQFYAELRRKGYEVKLGKYISVRPEGKERFFRLERNLGDDYSRDAIRERILNGSANDRQKKKKQGNTRKEGAVEDKGKKGVDRYRVSQGILYVRAPGSRRPVRGIRGLRAIYYRYLYRMGVLPGKQPQRVSFLMREDIRKLDQIYEEIKLLSGNRIDSMEQLFSLYRKFLHSAGRQ